MEQTLRRFPVYLVLDCSGSMAGEPIEAVRQGVRALLADLKSDPQALQTAYLSVITFAGSAVQACPLTELTTFQEPNLYAGGSTAMGAALRLLEQCVDKEVRKPGKDQKGDWKPLVFIMTDGQPTDKWEDAADSVKAKRLGKIFACAAGSAADVNVLKRITENVIRLDNLRPDSLRLFFRWVSSSITATSRSTVGVEWPIDLPPLPPPGGVVLPDEPSGAAALPDRGRPTAALETDEISPGVINDRVHFTIACPYQVVPNIKFILSFWAHLDRHRSDVLQRAREAILEAPRLTTIGPVKLVRGTHLTVVLSVDGLLIHEPEDTILWDGDIASATFSVFVPASTSEGPHVGVASVFAHGLRICRIHFAISVGRQLSSQVPLLTSEQRVRTAFASYAREDLDEVLARVQGIQKAGVEVFFDVLSLRSGQYWAQQLYKEIPARDIFYLFWSASAKDSMWVEKEWRCALETRGIDFIDPVPLVSPEIVPPPTELASKHFNDWTLAFARSRRV